MELCVTTKLMSRKDDGSPMAFEEMVEYASEAGFREFDYNLTESMLKRDDYKEFIDGQVEIMAKHGMRVHYVHLPYYYPNTDDEEVWAVFNNATMRGIEQAKALGAECAAIHPRCFMKEDYDEEIEHKNAVEFLKPFCDYAAKVGFPLAIENMRGPGRSGPQKIRRFACDTRELIEFADELGQGICWDTGHGNICMQNQLRSLKMIGKRLRMIHVDDNFGEDDIHLAPFIGTINWNEVVEGLKAVDYKGAMNIEVSCLKMPEIVRRDYVHYMAQSAKKLVNMFESVSL